MDLFLNSVWAVIVVLGVMVFIHELGHFLAAKYFGVRVERFSLGFPPRLFGIKRGDTDYCVGAIPLGGFVKMSGENPMENRTDDPGEFMNHPRWQRFIIALAGPAMNILFAVAVLTGVYMVHFEEPVFWSQPAVVGFVAPGSPAAQAGIQRGDLIVGIHGEHNPRWSDVQLQAGLSPGRPVSVTLRRDGKTFTTSVIPKGSAREDIGEAGWAPDRPIVVRNIDPTLPLAKTPVQDGDILTELNGHRLGSIEALMYDIKQIGEKPVELTYLHDGAQHTVTVTPKAALVEGQPRVRLGFIAGEEFRTEQLAFGAALQKSLRQNAKFSYLIVDVLKRLITRQVSLRQLEGPISIARESGQAVMERGWTPLLTLMVAISLNLGIFNLLPIPILDGGVILLLLIEGSMRRDISLHIKERIYQVAFVFLVIFAAMVIYNDLMKTVPGLDKFLP